VDWDDCEGRAHLLLETRRRSILFVCGSLMNDAAWLQLQSSSVRIDAAKTSGERRIIELCREGRRKEFPMKVESMFLFALVIAACPLAAQHGPAQGSAVGCVTEMDKPCPVPPPDTNRCPVSMRAVHLADGSMVKTSVAHPQGVGQWLSLSLTSLDKKEIAKATVTVHGLTPKGRMTQTRLNGASTPDATRTMSVPFSAGPDRVAFARIWVPGMSAVMEIDLRSMVYGDGSIWQSVDGQACEVKPDPLMLISGR